MFFREFTSNRNEENKNKNEQASILGFSILEINKILMYDFWHEYTSQKKAKKQNRVIWTQIYYSY